MCPPRCSNGLADAQVHPFPPEQFDLGISRFGTMFFADHVVAFADVHEPDFYGPDGATAQDAHDTGDGVYLDSRAWIVTATR